MTIIEVMQWMLDIQLGRRNLSPIQRIAVAEKYRPIYERQAKENLRLAKGGDRRSKEYVKNQGAEKLPQVDFSKKERNPTTSEKLADIAGVSEKTYRMGAKVLNSDNQKLKNEVLSGEKTISKAYKELQSENKKVQSSDDLNGEEFERLKNSIRDEKMYNDILVSPDMTIISGHQRVRAAKELGMKSVPIKIDEDLQDDNSKLRALISNNFGRRKNDPTKDRKALATYVELKGYRNGEIGKNHFQDSQNEKAEKFTLDEIAKELNMSKANLTRALSIERNLIHRLYEVSQNIFKSY